MHRPRPAGPGRPCRRIRAPPASSPAGYAEPGPDNGPVPRCRPDLQQVAYLVRDPQSCLAAHEYRGPPPAGQRVRDHSLVTYLADQGCDVVPQAEDSGASAVLDAVRRQFADDQDGVVRSAFAHQRLGELRDAVAELSQGRQVEAEFAD